MTDSLTPAMLLRARADAGDSARPHHRALRELVSELGYAVAARYLLWSAFLGSAVGVMVTLSLNDLSRRLVSEFLAALDDARTQGIDVARALASPAGVRHVEGGVTNIDNPLRYDFDRAWNAVGMLTGPGYAANALQFSALLVVPIAAVGVGLLLALKDYRHRTIQLRAIRSGLAPIHASMVLTATIMAAVIAVCASVGALVTGAVTRQSTLAGLESEYLAHTESSLTVGDVGLFLALALVSALLFASLGVAAGLVTRTVVVPMAAFTAVHLAVPMLGAWDPRQMVTTLFSVTPRFEGTLAVRVNDGASLGAAAGWLSALLLLVWVAGLVALRLRPRLGAGG